MFIFRLKQKRSGHVSAGANEGIGQTVIESDPFKYPNVLVVGTHNSKIPSSEILSFSSANNQNNQIEEYPLKVRDPVGEKLPGKDSIMICGGFDLVNRDASHSKKIKVIPSNNMRGVESVISHKKRNKRNNQKEK